MTDTETRLADLKRLLAKRTNAGPAWKESADAIRAEIARLEARQDEE